MIVIVLKSYGTCLDLETLHKLCCNYSSQFKILLFLIFGRKKFNIRQISTSLLVVKVGKRLEHDDTLHGWRQNFYGPNQDWTVKALKWTKVIYLFFSFFLKVCLSAFTGTMRSSFHFNSLSMRFLFILLILV